MLDTVESNTDYISVWNDILVPKFNRFRKILMEGLSFHSQVALQQLALPADGRVLDVGCGWGDTAIKLARKVGPQGRVVGLDCCDSFLQKGRDDAKSAGLKNLEFLCADVQTHPFKPEYDLCFSRFGTLFHHLGFHAFLKSLLFRQLLAGGVVADFLGNLHRGRSGFHRYAILLRLKARGTPSVACPLAGTKVHRTLVCYRLALPSRDIRTLSLAVLHRDKAQGGHPVRPFAALRLTPVQHRSARAWRLPAAGFRRGIPAPSRGLALS